MMKQLSIILSFIVLLVSCATITSPSGGEKDSEPPKLLSANPEIGTTNFSKNSFEVKFDEFLVREDFARQILVSPEIKTLKSNYYGKRLKFSWDEELLENTTYTFQFLNYIKDYNENNILAGFLYTFSTGPIIDSLNVSGEIVNRTYDASDELKVNLVRVSDFTDTTYLEGGFNFGTFSDKHGHFSFAYLPLDSFYIYGYEDKNANKQWDSKDERIAFFPDPIESSDSTVVTFDLFMEDQPSEFTQAKHSGFNKIELLFEDQKPEVNAIELFSYGELIPFRKVDQEDKVELIFDESITKDSLCVLVNHADTFPIYTVSYKKPKLEILMVTEHIIKNEKVILKSDYPIQELDTAKIKTFVQNDSLINHSIQLLEDGFSMELEYVNTELPVSIVFRDSALTYQDSIYNNIFNQSIIRKTLEDFSIIQCVFQSNAYPLIVQLHSDKDELLQEEYLDAGVTKIAFERILPGSYKLRYIVDRNGDRKFTTGSIHALRQPESVVKYKGSVQLKPNWITEIVFP